MHAIKINQYRVNKYNLLPSKKVNKLYSNLPIFSLEGNKELKTKENIKIHKPYNSSLNYCILNHQKKPNVYDKKF